MSIFFSVICFANFFAGIELSSYFCARLNIGEELATSD